LISEFYIDKFSHKIWTIYPYSFNAF